MRHVSRKRNAPDRNTECPHCNMTNNVTSQHARLSQQQARAKVCVMLQTHERQWGNCQAAAWNPCRPWEIHRAGAHALPVHKDGWLEPKYEWVNKHLFFVLNMLISKYALPLILPASWRLCVHRKCTCEGPRLRMKRPDVD